MVNEIVTRINMIFYIGVRKTNPYSYTSRMPMAKLSWIEFKNKNERKDALSSKELNYVYIKGHYRQLCPVCLIWPAERKSRVIENSSTSEAGKCLSNCRYACDTQDVGMTVRQNFLSQNV